MSVLDILDKVIYVITVLFDYYISQFI